MPLLDKVIRDPVHDLIVFSSSSPFDSLVLQLIGSKELQRLRRIKQLGFSSLVFPGADHTRFSHSIGVMWMARRMIHHLRQVSPNSFTDEEEQLLTLSALLHDLGHGPFSHAFEKVTSEDHESRTVEIIRDSATDIHKALKKFDPKAPELIARIISFEKPKKPYQNHIVSSQLDADRLDYIVRDTVMTGAKYGRFDFEWLLHTLTFDDRKERLVVGKKGLAAAEDYLNARHHLYKNVYFHKTTRSAEIMLRFALRRATDLIARGRLTLGKHASALSDLLKRKAVPLKKYLEIDEVLINQLLKEWCSHGDKILSALSNGIIHRRLLKAIDVTHVQSYATFAEMNEQCKKAVKRVGYDPNYFYDVDEPKDIAYKAYNPDEEEPGTVIYYQTTSGSKEISEISNLVRALREESRMKRIHFPEEARKDVLRIVSSAQ